MVLEKGSKDYQVLDIEHVLGDQNMKWLKELWNDESGAVATEYVILTGLIAVALIGVIVAFRTKIYELIQGFTSDISSTGDSAGDGS